MHSLTTAAALVMVLAAFTYGEALHGSTRTLQKESSPGHFDEALLEFLNETPAPALVDTHAPEKETPIASEKGTVDAAVKPETHQSAISPVQKNHSQTAGSLDQGGYIEPDDLPEMIPAPPPPILEVPEYEDADPWVDSAQASASEPVETPAQDSQVPAQTRPLPKQPEPQPEAPNPPAPTLPPSIQDESSETPEQVSPTPSQSGRFGEMLSVLNTPDWELGIGTATVNGEQWTRFGLGFEIPLGKIAAFFDVELFIDNQGKLSNKGWQFTKDTWAESIFRKIRYLRYGTESDPIYARFGGLANVTFGYGIVVDRFTNMLHYPDQKLLGLQLAVNNMGENEVFFQSMLADFRDFGKGGGLYAFRVGAKPFIKEEVAPPLANAIIAATFARDRNQYSGARDWHFRGDLRNYVDFWRSIGTPQHIIDSLVQRSQLDTTLSMSEIDTLYRESKVPVSVLGLDASIPLITSDLMNLDIYGQLATRTDRKGWSFGFPGAYLSVWRLTAQIEYRHVSGQYQPGFFGTYYLDERLHRYPTPSIKSERLPDVSLNGIYGSVAVDIYDFAVVRGVYQNLASAKHNDHRFEITGALDERILKYVPKVGILEAYYSKTDVPKSLKHALDFSAGTHFGYRLGIEMGSRTDMIFDMRYGFTYGENGRLKPSNVMTIQTRVGF